MALWLLGIPTLVGGLFAASGNRMRMQGTFWPFAWISGQFLLWAVFWVICVPCILLELDFTYVLYGYGAIALVLTAVGAGLLLWQGNRGHERKAVRDDADAKDPVDPGGRKLERLANAMTSVSAEKGGRVFWILFLLLLLFQLVQAVRMTYGDGDDAYYVAVSGITENAETMYRKLPYTGGTTHVDIRHGLAPFPIWIAFLARISGIRAVSVAHVAVPLVLIPATYLIFYLLGRKLFEGKEKRIPLFLIFTELLVLFGDYSLYTVENFMLARSRQGKAALGSIVVPMMFFLLLILLQQIQENRKPGISYWVLMVSVMMAGCLCTTMGALLLCMLLAVTGVCAAVSYRRWQVLVPLALCCIPCVGCALIYVMN